MAADGFLSRWARRKADARSGAPTLGGSPASSAPAGTGEPPLPTLPAAAGAPAHLVLLDADAGTCRAGRAAQGAPRISDGLFEHLLAEWAAYRRALRDLGDPAPFASITVLDRPAADRVRRIAISPSGRG